MLALLAHAFICFADWRDSASNSDKLLLFCTIQCNWSTITYYSCYFHFPWYILLGKMYFASLFSTRRYVINKHKISLCSSWKGGGAHRLFHFWAYINHTHIVLMVSNTHTLIHRWFHRASISFKWLFGVFWVECGIINSSSNYFTFWNYTDSK